MEEEKLTETTEVQETVPVTDSKDEVVADVPAEETEKKFKMTRKTYNLIVRLLGGVAAALILVSGISLLSDYISQKQIEKSSLLSQASGIKDATEMMTVGGESVDAEEYLYWTSNICTEFYYYYGITDFSEAVDEEMTAADYAKSYAEQEITQYAGIRAWAKELGITLTDEEKEEIEEEIVSYNSSYEDPDDAALYLKISGLSNDLLRNKILPASYLYYHVQEEYLTGSLKPAQTDLDAIVDEYKLITVKVIEIEPDSYEDEDVAAAEQKSHDLADRLAKASDIEAEWALIAEELGTENEAYLYDLSEETEITSKLAALEIGEFCEASDDDGCLCIYYRVEMDYDKVIDYKFQEDFQNKMNSYELTHTAACDSLDINSFFNKFVTLQGEAYATLPTADTTTEEIAIE